MAAWRAEHLQQLIRTTGYLTADELTVLLSAPGASFADDEINAYTHTLMSLDNISRRIMAPINISGGAND